MSADFCDSQEQIISSLPFGDDEKSRLRSTKNSSYKYQSLAALVALTDVIPDNSIDLKILRSTDKKPYFEQSPFHFSLSHTEKLSVAAICTAPVGIDIELLSSSRDTKKLVNRFFNEEEKALLQSSDDPTFTFYSIWTKKEALSKISGEGLTVLSAQNSFSCFCHQFILNLNNEIYVMSVCSLTPDEITLNNTYKELNVYEL